MKSFLQKVDLLTIELLVIEKMRVSIHRDFDARMTHLQGHILSAQIMADRNSYYDVLEDCQKGNGDITPWLDWFLDCFCRAINRSEGLLETVLDKAEFWKTHAQAPLSERQRKVINRMLDAGRGGFEGGLTTRKYVSLAGVSRATAFRELEQLLDLGILKKNTAGGRSTSYDLSWSERK